jgi:ABC-type proline/glycine betaine transport system substrate-binding protein
MNARRVRHAFAALAVAAAVGGLSQSVTASVVLIDSLNGATADGSVDISDTQWAAQTFTTTATDYVLDLLTVRLYNNAATAGDMVRAGAHFRQDGVAR